MLLLLPQPECKPPPLLIMLPAWSMLRRCSLCDCPPIHPSLLPFPCSHVLEVINDPKPPVRAAAIEALGRAITGALGSLPPAAAPGAAAGAGADAAAGAAAAAAESTGGVEHMLLVALEALHNGDKERDVRAGVLRVLLNVLQVRAEGKS